MAFNLVKEMLERYGMQAGAPLSSCVLSEGRSCVWVSPVLEEPLYFGSCSLSLSSRKQLVVASTANICESYLNWETCCTEWQNSHFEWHNCQLLDRGSLWIWRNCHSGEDVQCWVNELYKNMGMFVEFLCQCTLWFAKIIASVQEDKTIGPASQ